MERSADPRWGHRPWPWRRLLAAVGTASPPRGAADPDQDFRGRPDPTGIGRIERVEAGLELLARTFRAAFSELARSVEELRARPQSPALPPTEALDRLHAAVRGLTEAVERVPRVLAAAADHLEAELRASGSPWRDQGLERWKGRDGEEPEGVREAARRELVALAAAPTGDPLPATPFELEPIEEDPGGAS